MLTHPQDIALEIWCSQQTPFERQAPICDNPTDHPSTCHCLVKIYSWHGLECHLIQKKNTREVFNNSLKTLARGKTLSHDDIPNEVLKALPMTFHDMLFLFVRQCYLQKNNPRILETQQNHITPRASLDSNANIDLKITSQKQNIWM